MAGRNRNQKPIVDVQLENDIDRSAKVYIRNSDRYSEYLPNYGHAGKGPKNYHKSDESLREDVCQALYVSPEVDASKIDVDVRDHCVYLRGHVEDRSTKRKAEDVVDSVPGIRDVQNELTFIRPESMRQQLTDDERDLVNKMS